MKIKIAELRVVYAYYFFVLPSYMSDYFGKVAPIYYIELYMGSIMSVVSVFLFRVQLPDCRYSKHGNC